MNGHTEKVAFIWSVADLLRGDYKASDFGKVILPFVVLRRLDCVLEATKQAVLDRAKTVPEWATVAMRETILNGAAGESFHNLSPYTFARLKAEPDQLEAMRQAIEEGFILDVLANYTTYSTYYRFEKAMEDDPEVDKSKAKRALAQYASLHPHNLAQKAEVMIEHYRAHTRHKIGGRGKAMVVTRSRLHAVRYKRAFEDVIAAKGYTGLGVLTAFSGTVNDDGDEVTEVGMNGFGEAELPDRFASKDFHILIVAEKYQTGFDQPLLHTMFVDKKLKDLKAVQTLSRLNRTCAGKEDTFVLDFENKAEDIREAFKPYYEQPEIDEPTDPNQLYLLKAQLDAFQFYWGQEVLDFSKVFYKPVAKQVANDQGKLHAAIDPAIRRFAEEPDGDRQEEFGHLLDTYIRLYGFVSQIMPFEDAELERLYSYLRLMRTKLPRREGGGILDLEDDVNLAFYRLTRTFDGSVSLSAGDTGVLTGVQDVGTAKAKEDAFSPLSAVITLINDKFGTDFDDNDKLFWDQVNNDLSKDDALTQQARTNNLENFRHAFDPKAINAVLDRSERNTHAFEQFMADDNMRRMLLSALAAEFHANARRPAQRVDEIAALCAGDRSHGGVSTHHREDYSTCCFVSEPGSG